MKESKIYGYIRVSSRDQNEARQVLALQQAGVPTGQIYMDKQSGKDFNRPKYKCMVKKLKAGDLLIVKSIDRLGRNYAEVIQQWSLITKTIRADILVLDMPLLDTRKQSRDLTDTFVADLVLQILSYVAQSEREATRQRQAEGIAAAKDRGVAFGRRQKELPENFAEVCHAYQAGVLTMRAAAQRLSMSVATFCRRYHTQMDVLEEGKEIVRKSGCRAQKRFLLVVQSKRKWEIMKLFCFKM